VAAGVLGAAATAFTDPQGSLTVDDRRSGAEAIELLDRTSYHVGAVTGFLAVACLLVAASGWRRFTERHAPESLAGRLVPAALAATAAAAIVGYGFKGALAIYLDGGINENEYPAEGLYPLFMINDLAPFLAWWGVAVAAAGVAWLSLREKLVPTWMGLISVVAAAAPLAFLVATGLTGFAGVAGPLWLAVVSGGLVVRGEKPAPAARKAALAG